MMDMDTPSHIGLNTIFMTVLLQSASTIKALTHSSVDTEHTAKIKFLF